MSPQSNHKTRFVFCYILLFLLFAFTVACVAWIRPLEIRHILDNKSDASIIYIGFDFSSSQADAANIEHLEVLTKNFRNSIYFGRTSPSDWRSLASTATFKMSNGATNIVYIWLIKREDRFYFDIAIPDTHTLLQENVYYQVDITDIESPEIKKILREFVRLKPT
jgi:hypothetical protein